MINLSTSVILTTYNGNQYISAQMDSLRQQTWLPNEVLIFDDCSSDETANTVRTYIDKYNLMNWKLFINKKNKGWRKNFIDALLCATADIVFLCDQDDIWLPHKIEHMLKIMHQTPEAMLLFSNVKRVYGGECQNLNVLKNSYIHLKKINLTVANLRIGRPGCCFCVRREEMQNNIRLYYLEGLAHDAFLWICALLQDKLYIVNETTVLYRQHNSNASNIKMRTRKSRLESVVLDEKYQNLCEKLLIQYGELWPLRTIKKIKRKRSYLQSRKLLLTSPSLKNGCANLKYLQYYPRIRTLIMDWYCAFKSQV